jgi:hypothetical protein
VGARQCLRADPDLHDAIDVLRSTSLGPALLRTTAEKEVQIRVGRASPDAAAQFSTRSRTITIDSSLMRYSDRALAAVVAHELRHVSDWARSGPMFGNSFSCFDTEANAIKTETAVWRELRGSSPPEDALEYALDELDHEVAHGGARFWLGVGGDYLADCT